MKIAIIGAGSMGAFFGARLLQAGHTVTLVTRREAHAAQMNRHGLLIATEMGTERIPVQAVHDMRQVEPPEWVLFCVKAYDTQAAADAWAAVDRGTATLITLQNGLGNADILASQFGPERVLAGTTSTGCTSLGDGQLQLNHLGQVQLGAMSPLGQARLQQAVAALNAAGLPALADQDIRRTLWAKLFVNVGINALTALTGRRNGQLLDAGETQELMELLVAEAVTVARAAGLEFDLRAVLQQVFAIARATGNNRSSMLQDIERGRRTEVDMINGAVVTTAQRLGLAAPVNQTLRLLVKTVEKDKGK